MNKCILVTGGTGFIGSSLVRKLVSSGYKVKVLDNNSRGSEKRLKDVACEIEFIEADIRNYTAVDNAMKGVETVLHLAYINGTEFFYSKPELVLDIAIRGMLNIVDACRANNVYEISIASSSETYQNPPLIPTTEDVPVTIPDIMNPRYSYGGGKIACELIAINYGRNFFDRVTIFRPHNVYGPDMGWEHVLPQFVVRASNSIKNTPTGEVNFEIQGDGSQTRAFLHIDDLTKGVMTILEKGEHLNIYNIGNEEEIEIKKVAKLIFKLLSREPKIISTPISPGSPQRRCPDITKIKKLGYMPQIPFEKGLPSLVDWYLNNEKYDS